MGQTVREAAKREMGKLVVLSKVHPSSFQLETKRSKLDFTMGSGFVTRVNSCNYRKYYTFFFFLDCQSPIHHLSKSMRM
jgi:hypothetical protein